MPTTDKPCTQVKDSPEADLFAMVVQDHIGWVYSCARRHLCDGSLADDAVQAVFMALWRKRKRLAAGTKPIGGWLLCATRHACNDLRKLNRRRDHHERKAAAMRSEEMRPSDEAAESKTEQLLALDAAMQKLSTAERDILVARFFQNHTAREVSEHWRISEAAAEKRTSRAVEKLRQIMARKKFSMDSMAIASLLTSSTGTAPSGLLRQVSQGITGKAPISLTATHAARHIAFHTAHIPAIATAAAVTLAVGVAAIVPVALTPQHASKKAPPPAQTISAPQAVAADSSAAGKGVLTCVAYEMLVQKDFAWAIKAGGTLISGKPGGVQAYNISARAVRALARAQSGGHRIILYSGLARFVPLIGAPEPAEVTQPGIFDARHTFTGNNVVKSLDMQMDFKWRGKTFPDFIQMELQFNPSDNVTYSTFNGRLPWTAHTLPYTSQGTSDVGPGRATVLIRHALQFQGTQWYNAMVFEVQRYPFQLLATINQTIDFATGAKHYIRTGPAGLQRSADIAVAWNTYALAHPVARTAEWARTFPDGASVRLDRVSSHLRLYSWTPGGVPLPGLRSYYLATDGVAGLLKFEPPANEAGKYKIRIRNRVIRTAVERQWVQIMGKADTISVGRDSGIWKIIGTAAPSTNPTTVPVPFAYMGHKFGDLSMTPQPANPAAGIPGRIQLSWSAPPAPDLSDQAIAVGAVNQHGQLVSPHSVFHSELSRFLTSRAEATNEYAIGETILIASSDVKRYVWITRPRHWVTFCGIALKPLISPGAVFALEQTNHTAPVNPGLTAKPTVKVTADQTTPDGLMLLFQQAIERGDQPAMAKLFYTPTKLEQRMAAVLTNTLAYQQAYGLWAAAKKRFGLAQLEAAELDSIIVDASNLPKLPVHWKIQGQHAVPVIPLPPGVRWPAKGPLHALIERNGRWCFDLDLTNPQIAGANAQLQMQLRRAKESQRNAAAYKALLQQLQAGNIKDAYALRDALNAALKHFSKPPK